MDTAPVQRAGSDTFILAVTDTVAQGAPQRYARDGELPILRATSCWRISKLRVGRLCSPSTSDPVEQSGNSWFHLDPARACARRCTPIETQRMRTNRMLQHFPVRTRWGPRTRCGRAEEEPAAVAFHTLVVLGRSVYSEYNAKDPI